MRTIESALRTMRIKIIVPVCIYCVFLFSVFLFVAIKINLLFGLGSIVIFFLILFFFTIPAYKTRLDLGKKFCNDIIQSSNAWPKTLQTIIRSNNPIEIHINIYSFDSKFRLLINATLDSQEILEIDCLTISNKLDEILQRYDAKKNTSGYVNFDALLVGMIALWLLEKDIHGVRVSLKLSVRGYNQDFSFIDDQKRAVVQRIKHSLLYQAL